MREFEKKHFSETQLLDECEDVATLDQYFPNPVTISSSLLSLAIDQKSIIPLGIIDHLLLTISINKLPP